MTNPFDYHTAFSRNVGWVTETEQRILRSKRVAIAGMGGRHLLTLTRLGVGSFSIADFDTFDMLNFNRQAGASMSHLCRPKVEALAEMAFDINPTLHLRCFPEGLTRTNLGEFLDAADIYVDGLDFFAFEMRRSVFSACHERGIPAITAAPLGMSAALLVFMPGKMRFETYLRWEGHSDTEQGLRFLVGLAPAGLHRGYLVDPARIDLKARRGPSTPMGCELCTRVTGAQVLKILLRRGKIRSAPHGMQFDAYRDRLVRTWRPGGNRNPLQKLSLFIGRRRPAPRILDAPFDERERRTETDGARDGDLIDEILDVARWAPSGDNTQPWRFARVNDRHFTVHGSDTREHSIYDLDGHSSQVALGALLENTGIAAAEQGQSVVFRRKPDMPETTPTFDVFLDANETVRPKPVVSLHLLSRDAAQAPIAPTFDVGEKTPIRSDDCTTRPPCRLVRHLA